MPRAMRVGGSVAGRERRAREARLAGERNDACERVRERGLSVAFDPRDADDLACANLERRVVQRARARTRRKAAHVEQRRRLALRAARERGDVAADHLARDVRGVRLGRRVSRHDASGAHHRHALRVCDHFGELVRDHEDRRAAARELADRREERRDLARRERGRRLVEEQHGRLAIELAQELDALLDADRQRLDDRVRIDGQAVALGERAHACVRGGHVDRPAAARLAVQQHVLPDAQPFDQLEVLVYEADDAVGFDVAVVGAHRTVRDRGERRFARAVLADERVNLAGDQLEVDAVERLDRAEALANAAQRQSGTRVNDASSSRVDGTATLPAMIAAFSVASTARRSRRDDARRVREVRQAHAAFFEPERQVLRARPARRGVLADAKDADVDALHHARENFAGQQRVLVGVDADDVARRGAS